MEFVREQTLGAVAELMEALNESGWKSWKSRGFGETDKERTADELADVFIFVTNLALAAGLTWRDLDGGIRRAWFKNDEREKNGY
jgi:NTP pyrophosphatase (non-canonical NTP hydrolase)